MWRRTPGARCVFLAPYSDLLDLRMKHFQTTYASLDKHFVKLTGDTTKDLVLLQQGDVIFSTPDHWDLLSRRWKHRKNIQTIGLLLVEQLHQIASPLGPALEICLSRMRFIAAQTGSPIRIVALSTSLANARDLGEWIGAPKQNIFNFHPSVRVSPLNLALHSIANSHHPSLMLALVKPVFNAVKETRAVVFVGGRRQCNATARELVAVFAATGTPLLSNHRKSHIQSVLSKVSDPALAEGKSDIQSDLSRVSDPALAEGKSDIQSVLSKVSDPALAESLACGVGLLHEALTREDRELVEALYKAGAITLVVASREVCWGIGIQAEVVVVMGCQQYQGKEHRYVDYSIGEILQMVGVASTSQHDTDKQQAKHAKHAKCVIMCQTSKKEFYKKFLNEPLPVESHLDHFLHDHFNAEIVTKTIESKQDAVDYLTWTFYYRRLLLNPNYYNLQGNAVTQKVDSRHLSDHLSELVEQTLEDLTTSKCISLDDDLVSPLNLGMIAAHYHITYVTLELFSMSLTQKTKMRGLLEILTAASEFEDLPIRRGEEGLLARIAGRVPVKIEGVNYGNPHHKANLLLQAHFGRLTLPADLASDQTLILTRILNLIHACIDVISSNGWLQPALAAMEFSQMCVQGLMDRDSPLRQIPHLTPAHITALHSENVENVFDFIEMPESTRTSLLSLTNRETRDVAEWANAYPNVEVDYECGSGASGTTTTLRVLLTRDADDPDANANVHPHEIRAPYFPVVKREGWYLLLAHPATKTLLALKRTGLAGNVQVKLDFVVPEVESGEGKMWMKLYLVSDCWAGCDQEYDVEVEVTGNLQPEDEEDVMDET